MELQILPRVIAAAAEVEEAEPYARYAPEPWEEVLPGETVVNPKGEFPDKLKRLYVVWAQAQSASEHNLTNFRNLVLAESKDMNDPCYQERRIETARLSNLAMILANIFNAEMRVTFPETAMRPLVFIRKGWRVVWRGPFERPGSAAPPPTAAETPPNLLH